MIKLLISQKIFESWLFVTRAVMSQKTSALNRLSIFVFFIIASVVLHDVEAKPPQRLVSGSDAAPGEMFFQASLKKHGKHFCGGTIVSPRNILTAAHCVYDLKYPYRDLKVVTGTNSLEKGGQVSVVDNIDIHPNYSSNADGSFSYDLALLQLSGDIEMNNFQSPISLPETDDIDNSIAIISGWGMTYEEYPDGEYSKILQKSEMTVLTRHECQKIHKLNKIGVDNVCGFKDSDSGLCTGDDGSPLVIAKGHTGQPVLIGIASWWWPCGSGLPDVYVRVYHCYDWILEGILKAFWDIGMD